MKIEKNVAIIAGNTGTLGPEISAELKTKGIEVYGGSRSNKTDFQYTQTDLISKEFWQKIIQQYAESSNTVLLVNTIGQASAPPGSTLEDVNIRPVVALAQAGKDFAKKNPDKKVVVVQISAIAAIYLSNDIYGKTRAEADRQVVALGNERPIENYQTLALQLPFVFVEPKEDPNHPGHYFIKGLHPWSMEQIAGLPIVPLAGMGKQVVYPVNLKDVTASVANAIGIKESKAIEVKGGTGLTQKDLIHFYAKMHKRSILFIPIPSLILSVALDQFPYGLLAGYAPRVMQQLSNKDTRTENEPFDELLGKRAQGIEAAHKGLDTDKVTLASPPIGSHLYAHAGKIATTCLGTIAIVGGILYLASNRK